MSKDQVDDYAAKLKQAMRKSVKVGITETQASRQVYDDGQSVLEVGAGHEYGVAHLPRRSFLKMPMEQKEDELQKTLRREYQKIAETSQTVNDALGIVGAKATNISKEAFVTQGYGKWPDITEETKEQKRSSQTLIDTGTLRNSITWEVE